MEDTQAVVPAIQIFYRPQKIQNEEWQIRAVCPNSNLVLGHVNLRGLRECSCACMVFNLGVLEGYRRKGIARSLMAHVETAARDNRIALLMATVNTQNIGSRSLMQSCGFDTAKEWQNPRTGNTLLLYTKILR